MGRLPRLDVSSDVRVKVNNGDQAEFTCGQDLGCLLRGMEEARGFRCGNGTVECIGHRDCSDEDEHDQSHALLAIIGSVGKAHTSAGQDQDSESTAEVVAGLPEPGTRLDFL